MFQLVALVTLAPSLLLMWYFHSRDVYPEPPRVLWATFGLGVLAILPVLIVALPTISLFQGVTNVYAAGFLDAFFSAAIPEEFFKFLVLTLYCSRHKEFNEPMDGIVYGVAASLGFATLENVMYVSGGGLGLAILRGFTAVPGHAFTGAIMGYYVGQARFASTGRARWMIAGYFVPMILHGLYDLPLLTLQKFSMRGIQPSDFEQVVMLGGVIMALTVLIVEWVWAVRVSKRMRREQQRDASEHAAAEAAKPFAGGIDAPSWVVPAPAPAAATAGSPVGGWIMLLLGGLSASGGALLTLILVAGSALSPEPIPNLLAVVLVTGVIGIAPLVVGVVLFWLGLRQINAASRPAQS